MSFICQFAVFFLISIIATDATSSNSSSNTTCVCTTVPCPVEGPNYLTNGGGSVGTYNYILQNGHAVVSSASITIAASSVGKGSDTTSCTQSYSRSLDDVKTTKHSSTFICFKLLFQLQDGVQDCDAGHILANNLGGLGNQPINIFPQVLLIHFDQKK